MSLQRDLLRARRRNSDLDFSFPRSSIPKESTKPSVIFTNNERETLSGERVQVAVRVRPPFTSETSQPIIVAMDPSKSIVSVEGRMDEKQFFVVDMPLCSCSGKALDGSFSVTQSAMYEHVGRPLLHHALEGFNSTMMAYGQTGSGKTYTMMGDIGQNVEDDDDEDVLNDSEEGIIPRLCRDMFKSFRDRSFATSSGEGASWEVYVSFVEVYCEKISDLLDNGKYLSLRDEVIDNETHFSLVGARRLQATKASDVLHALRTGNKFRKTSATHTNERSSRSHAVFILELTEVVHFLDSAGEKVKIPNKHLTIRLVDLAGSERLGETGVQGQRFKEGVEINLSLFTLGMVIESLTDVKRRGIKPPYRESTLTKLLKDAFGGNSKTTMICTIAPTAAHRSQTVQTLQYGSRARSVVNKPKVVRHSPTTAIGKVDEEMLFLRNQILDAGSEAGKRHDSLQEQLAQANKRLREEQDASRCLKLFLQQKDKKLALRKREMEEQQRVYEIRIQQLEAELERTKVKQKERDRELQKASRKAATVTEEFREKMNLQRALLQEQLQQEFGKMLRKHHESEKHMKQVCDGLAGRFEELSQKVAIVKKKLKMKEIAAMELEKRIHEKTIKKEKKLRSKLLNAQFMLKALQEKAPVLDNDAVSEVPGIQDKRLKSEGLELTQVTRDGTLHWTDVRKKPEIAVNHHSCNNDKPVELCKEEPQDLDGCGEERHAEPEAQAKHVEMEQREISKNIDELQQFALQESRLDSQERNQHDESDKEKAKKRGERGLSGSQFGSYAVTDVILDISAGKGAVIMPGTVMKPSLALSSGHAEDLAACLRLGRPVKEVLSSCGLWYVELLESALRAALLAQEGQEGCFIMQQAQHEQWRAMESRRESRRGETQQGELGMLRLLCSHCGAEQPVVEMGERCQVLPGEIQASERCLIKRFETAAETLRKSDALGKALCSACDIDSQARFFQMLLLEEGMVAGNLSLAERISIPEQRYFQSEESRLSQKTEMAEAELPYLESVDAGTVSANRLTDVELVAVDKQPCEVEVKFDAGIKHMQPTIAEQTAVQMAESIVMWEASERECIERLFNLQLDQHLCHYTRGRIFTAAQGLLFMENAQGGGGERHFGCRDVGLDVVLEDDQQMFINQRERQIHEFFFTSGSGIGGANPTHEKSEQPISEMGRSCGDLQKQKVEVTEKLSGFQLEAQKQEHYLEQMEDHLEQQLGDSEQCVQKRIADIDCRQKEVASVARANKRTLKDREASLQALILKIKECEGQIRQREEELERQRLRYVELGKLLEDRNRLLRHERAHRVNGRHCATEVTEDLLDVNDFLKRQLEVWIRKYKVLKSDEKVECERCSWQNGRDATVCCCCGNDQLV